jgi:hypothetical protein
MHNARVLGKWVSWMAVGLFLLAPAVRAEPPKPVVVVSVAGYQKLVDDLSLLGRWADRPELSTALEGMISLATGGKGLAGLDKNRPMALVLQTDGQRFSPYLLVPVTDLEKLLGVVEPLLQRPIAKNNGVYELSFERGRKLYVQARSADWAVGAETQEALAAVPEQIPEEVRQKLPEGWTLGASVLVKNIAPEQRRQWAERLRSDAARELTPRPGESEEDFKVRKWLSEWLADWAASALDQVEQLQIGLGVDASREALVVEMAVQPAAGSALAEAMQKAGQAQTAFGGVLLPEAALSAHAVVRYPAGEFHQVAPVVEMLKVRALQQRPRPGQTPEQAQAQRELTTALLDLVEKTLKSGRVEGAFSVLLQPDRFTLLAGAYVADGRALEKLLERLVAEARKERPAEVDRYVKLRAHEVQGVHLHVVRFPVPAEAQRREALIQLIGPEVELVLGTGPETLYVGLGKGAEATLRQAIEKDAQGPQQAAPAQIHLAVKPVLAVLAEHGNQNQQEKARQLLEKMSNKDRLRLAVESAQGRMRLRLEVQQDVLAVLAQAAQQQ